MSSGEEFIDWYAVLNIGQDATDKQIQKAYRMLALVYHPDKNKSKEAVIMFEKISKANKTLTEKSTRDAFDLQLKGKLEKKKRDDDMDKKRKKMKDDLTTREEEHRKKKQKEAEDKRKENAKYREDVLREVQQQSNITSNNNNNNSPKKGNNNIGSSSRGGYDPTTSSIDRNNILILKWKYKLKFREETLVDIFSSYGMVDSVVILERNIQNDPTELNRAIIYFKSSSTINNIIQNHEDDIRKKFRITIDKPNINKLADLSKQNNNTTSTRDHSSSSSSSQPIIYFDPLNVNNSVDDVHKITFEEKETRLLAKLSSMIPS
ncbi:hypothetical protein DFA_06238 [Cavenderia fasciculata]|uniref:J domain-containing protein n=1 Tax=Cavenderia fasciculata TaxID=261658 RepID=F4PKH5_CACFS|nr:uncharacterized protein DFA_06238 [Cavenderia fasciculata]EGG24099.1 hypothetical protein DFA_06238 [Cavenderia fasciculata]|eukprot:XP_004361950.1 hypothetical protein DFA_06238 [Cavenderia fasciculata]